MLLLSIFNESEERFSRHIFLILFKRLSICHFFLFICRHNTLFSEFFNSLLIVTPQSQPVPAFGPNFAAAFATESVYECLERATLATEGRRLAMKASHHVHLAYLLSIIDDIIHPPSEHAAFFHCLVVPAFTDDDPRR